MYDDLVKRLRAVAGGGREEKCDGCPCEEDYPCCVDCLDKLHKQAADAIEGLSKPRWVSVTERLPQDDVAVLVTYIGFLSGKPQANMLAFRRGGVWLWLDDWLGERPTSHIECAAPITHWMPLPDPPNGEE